jgi:hypothetical protein
MEPALHQLITSPHPKSPRYPHCCGPSPPSRTPRTSLSMAQRGRAPSLHTGPSPTQGSGVCTSCLVLDFQCGSRLGQVTQGWVSWVLLTDLHLTGAWGYLPVPLESCSFCLP